MLSVPFKRRPVFVHGIPSRFTEGGALCPGYQLRDVRIDTDIGENEEGK
jgi:hypothetical protein